MVAGAGAVAAVGTAIGCIGRRGSAVCFRVLCLTANGRRTRAGRAHQTAASIVPSTTLTQRDSNLADVDFDECCDRRQGLATVPHPLDGGLHAGEVPRPLLSRVGAHVLRGLVDPLTFPRIDGTNSLQHHPDHCRIVGIGSVPAVPLVVRHRLSLTRSTSGQQLRIRVHIRNVRSGARVSPPPKPHSR